MTIVKPIEWLTRESRDSGRLQSISHTIVGTYAVTDCTDLGFVEWLNRSGGKVGKCKTMAEAKAEAFADYSARIMSAIEPAGVGVGTVITDDQIERAEWKLAEVLAGHDYTMPTDGMRRVLVAALKGDEQ